MSRSAVARLAGSLALALGLSLACGRYGPPERTLPPPAPAAAPAPDPADPAAPGAAAPQEAGEEAPAPGEAADGDRLAPERDFDAAEEDEETTP